MQKLAKPAPGELLEAVSACDIERARALLARGADPDERSADTWCGDDTVLHLALIHERTGELAKMLIESGANPEATNSHGFTPLMYAARYRNRHVLRLLIEKGVTLDAKDKDGFTALKWAELNGYPEIIKALTKALALQQQQAEEKAACSTEQTRITSLHDTAATRQEVLKKRRPKVTLKP